MYVYAEFLFSKIYIETEWQCNLQWIGIIQEKATELIRPSVVVCYLLQGSVLMNYSTLLDSIKKSAQTQAELINSEMKGVRCVPPLDQQTIHENPCLQLFGRELWKTGLQYTIFVNIFLLCEAILPEAFWIL